MFAKEGVSPLIGTVLLISFGLAFSLIILNIDFLNPCNNLFIEVSEYPAPCYDAQEKAISLVLKHQRGSDIVGVKYLIIDGENIIYQSDFFSFMLSRDEVQRLRIPYDDKGTGEGPKKVIIMPVVMKVGDQLACDKLKSQIVLFDLPRCE